MHYTRATRHAVMRTLVTLLRLDHTACHQRRYTAHSSISPTATTNGAGLPPLSLSILGVEPLDEFTLEIADFIHHHVATRPAHLTGAIEVEAKLGVLRDKASGARLMLPVATETILASTFADTRFDANMSMAQHKHFNVLLNNLKTGASPRPGNAAEISYAHLHLVDSFYAGDGADKVRVTRDERTGDVHECMRKVRLGNLDIFCPKRAVDWRVSVNVEVPVPHPVGSATHTRKKDRMSYTHEEFRIDLTQVTSSTHGGPAEVLHELEIEVARPELLVALAAKRGEPGVPEHERDAFNELVRAFVNNARILVRNAGV
ncbi:mRNA capping enzyme [Vararia minispora EC-137]|uniref:mRNA capping enzyme n=1 Tax=Vararia minispora EC-137 TaxID=1314806 RepID=A0ACB8QYW5_9AGAM|nr:mRNA capping enzyme [Vararia minispora EC-137]